MFGRRKDCLPFTGDQRIVFVAANLRYAWWMERRHAKLVATLLLAAAAVAAESAAAAEPEVRCACRNRDGSKYTLGQIACLTVGGVSYLARCEMNLNVLTWRKLRDGCPTAQATTGTFSSIEATEQCARQCHLNWETVGGNFRFDPKGETGDSCRRVADCLLSACALVQRLSQRHDLGLQAGEVGCIPAAGVGDAVRDRRRLSPSA